MPALHPAPLSSGGAPVYAVVPIAATECTAACVESTYPALPVPLGFGQIEVATQPRKLELSGSMV